MAIPIFACIETCYDKFDVMITPFSALEFIIGRYIYNAYYYYYYYTSLNIINYACLFKNGKKTTVHYVNSL